LDDPLPDQYYKGNWVFILKEVDKAITRLKCRSRNKISAGFGTGLFYNFIGTASIIMNQNNTRNVPTVRWSPWGWCLTQVVETMRFITV